jgi:hypothetical protein
MTKRGFKLLIIVKWVLFILIVVALLLTERFLPPELRSYNEGIRNSPATTEGWILLAVGTAFLLFGIVLSVGLFQFKKWAKQLLLLSYIIGILLILFSGPSIQTIWTEILSYMASLVDGMILALVYYSPVGEMFETKNAA